MTTASRQRTYSSSALLTTSETVSPFSSARSFAAFHTSSGTRTFLSLVPRGMSDGPDAGTDLGTGTRTLAGVGQAAQGGGALDVARALGGVGVLSHLGDDRGGAGGDAGGLGARDGAHRDSSVGAAGACRYTVTDGVGTRNPPTLDTFLDIAAALDFDLSCQHHQHAVKHAENDPAAYFVWTACRWCRHVSDYYLCESGRASMWHPHLIGCSNRACGATGGWDDFVLLYVPIGSK